MYEYKVEFFPVLPELTDEISDCFVKNCVFCDKEVEINKQNNNQLAKQIDNELFYCSFCFRNEYHLKNNYFIFSFKSIILHYYEAFYCKSHNRSVWLSQIQQMIDLHKEVGLSNFAFNYDDDTFTWFVNLSKINKCETDEIYKIIIEMIICFNFWHINIDGSIVFNYIKKAIDEALLEKKLIRCIPVVSSKIPLAKVKNFCLNKMIARDLV